jgi:hypothetical protein
MKSVHEREGNVMVFVNQNSKVLHTSDDYIFRDQRFHRQKRNKIKTYKVDSLCGVFLAVGDVTIVVNNM